MKESTTVLLSFMAAGPSYAYATACRVDAGALAGAAAVGFGNGGGRGCTVNAPRASGFGRRGIGGNASLLLSSSWSGGALIHHRRLRTAGAAGQVSDFFSCASN